VTAVDAGLNHSMALRSDGTVWSWGRNDYGQLGNGSAMSGSSRSTSPVQVVGVGGTGFLTGIDRIWAGSSRADRSFAWEMP
jgi:hypothetical protein